MPAKRRYYQRIPCQYCRKEIAYNRMAWHVENHCKPAREAGDGIRRRRITTAPFEGMTLGEITEAGRLEEFKVYLIVRGLRNENSEG